MKKLKHIFFLLLLCFSWPGHTQNNSVQNLPNSNLPVEEVYLHLNTNNIFAGENLLYKIYVTTEDSLLSNYSKVAYIQLIGPKRNILLKQKVMLSHGQGFGDFFIPAETPTGNYKLIAFTKMGLKQVTNTVFSTDLSVINPYIPVDPNLVNVIDNSPVNIEDTKKAELKSSVIQIKLSDSILEKREKVELGIIVNDHLNLGDYSISVKKIDVFQLQKQTTILRHGNYQQSIKLKNASNFLPELRGELISGRIIASNESAPIQNQGIALLIPDDDFVIQIGRTDKQGRFYLNINNAYSSTNAFLQVINEFNNSYSFEVDEEPILDLSSISVEKLKLFKSFEQQIVDKSIKNQIQNSYSSVRPNTFNPNYQSLFFGKKGVTYNLDDYTRFPNLNETFVEIIKGVSFKKEGDGGHEIVVRATDYTTQSPIKPLVLVDGLLVQDHSLLYDFNAFDIQNIHVVNEKYFYGGNVFQGIVSIETKENAYQNLVDLMNIKSLEIVSPEKEKTYHNVSYNSNDDLKHIPDYRTQLFWKPNLKLSSSKSHLEFFTSDESGVFEIVVEGISLKGEKIRATKLFKVF